MAVCDISSAKVQTKAEKIERNLCLLWHTVSNHILKINALPRPQGQIADIFFKEMNPEGAWKSIYCKKTVYKCVAWYPLLDKWCWGGNKIGKIKGFHWEQRQREDSGMEEGDGPQAKGLTSWGQ